MRHTTQPLLKIKKKGFLIKPNLQHYVDDDKQEMELIHNITKIKRPLLYIRHVYFIRFNAFGKVLHPEIPVSIVVTTV